MNICLVRLKFDGEQKTVYPPMGLLTIAPYFSKEHKLFMADLQTDGDRVGFLGNGFDVVLFSAFTSQLSTVQKHIATAKEMGITSKFIVGGPGVTSNPEYAKALVPSADLLVAGDGEYFAEGLASFLAYGKDIIDFRQHPYLLECKKLPSWDLVNYQRFRDTVGFGVETSRGCCFNCVMCTAHMIHSKKWRPRKPEDVVWELKYLKDRYGCKKFYFADDNATVDPNRWFELMQKIAAKKLGLDLSVPEGIQAHHLDYDTLKAMKEAGLTRFTIGAESGNQRVLDEVINKGGLTVDKIEEVVRLAKSLGMKASCFFVIGFIGETLEEAKQTVDFAEKLRHYGAENCTVRNAIPMPGTRLFSIAKEMGCLAVPEEKLFDSNFVHTSQHLLKTSEWNPEDISRLVVTAKEQERRHIIQSNIFVHPRATLKLALNRKL